MKTENDRGEDDHHRSPDIGRSDMRETWRRPRIPYNKLPEVFNQQKQKKYPHLSILENMDPRSSKI